MPDRTLAIVFRNPDPKRIPIHTELYLFRRDGSGAHLKCHEPEPSASKRAARETGITGWLSSLQ